ncbi:hypothetical protein HK100_005751 [Physocladia obscura]|uniref:Uncharacterized protein n=1 Tax=Physocladia obscura TaxID=109957 RepID=A0AAD5X957_9FUNG|nr:hypothetical protein HK100_005751 [Physocladia obscura]
MRISATGSFWLSCGCVATTKTLEFSLKTTTVDTREYLNQREENVDECLYPKKGLDQPQRGSFGSFDSFDSLAECFALVLTMDPTAFDACSLPAPLASLCVATAAVCSRTRRD